MKRALTGIAAAAVVLGTAAPMAFAATSSGLTKAGQLPIVVNGSVLSNPYEMTGKDSGNTTAYFPVYYFDQALTKIGYTATWDGVTHTWAITAPGVDASTVASSIAGGVGTGNTTITVNGTVVKKINTKAAKDPAASKSAAATTYFPAYYIDEIFNGLGANVSFSGQTGLKITGSATSVDATLSNLTFSGATMGSGTSTSPAVESGTGAVAVSTTLTDASGNPVSGIDVTYTVTGGTNSAAPTATSGSKEISATDAGSYTWTYQVATNTAGVATINFSNPSNGSYSIVASAPFSVNGSNVTSNTGYLEFGQPGSIVISPISATETFSSSSNATSGLVPVTVTVIPSVSGASASNIPVAFTLSNSGDTDAYFATSAGAEYTSATTTTVYTNASGQATAYLNANGAAEATVSATATAAGLSNPTAETQTLTWKAAGTATQISGFSGDNQTVNKNTNVTFSGQVEDALGNPVANAQVLVSANDNGNNDVSYVNGSTTTAFPNVGTNIAGVVASSSFGDLVTTDANGNFSVTVTDSNAETPTFQFWAVNNGYVSAGGSGLNGALETVGTGYNPVTWGNTSSALSDVYIDTSAANLASDADTSITGSYEDGNAGTVYVAGYEGNGDIYAPVSTTVQYTITSNNSGSISEVDGVSLDGSGNLPNSPSSAIVDVTYNSSGDVSSVAVDGATLQSPTITSETAFSFVPNSTKVESDTFTVTTGSYSATLKADFSAGSAAEYAASPSVASVGTGASQSIQFTIEDANGNPVPYGTAKLNIGSTKALNDLWITAVNGQQLAENVVVGGTSYGTQQTAIPLFNSNAEADSNGTTYTAYPTVFVPGAVSATGVGTANPSITLTADEDGHVSVTFTAGGNGYFATTSTTSGNTSDVDSTVPSTVASSGLNAYFSYTSDGKLYVDGAPNSSNTSVATLGY